MSGAQVAPNTSHTMAEARVAQEQSATYSVAHVRLKSFGSVCTLLLVGCASADRDESQLEEQEAKQGPKSCN